MSRYIQIVLNIILITKQESFFLVLLFVYFLLNIECLFIYR